MILAYYDKYINSKKNEVSKRTIINLEQTTVFVRKYLDHTDRKRLTFGDINQQFFEDFKAWSKQCGYSLATFGKHVEHIRSLMSWAEDHGLHNNRYYRKMRVQTVRSDDAALTSDELKRIWQTEFDMPLVIEMIEERNRHRFPGYGHKVKRFKRFLADMDFFYAMCSSGTYINDLLSLTRDNIKNGLVIYNRFKGRHCYSNECQFPYKDNEVFKFVAIAEKCDFGFHRYNELGNDVKTLMDYVGIDKNISTKSGRKTYASILHYELGAPDSLVMSVLGHTKWESTRHYLNQDKHTTKDQFETLYTGQGGQS